MENRFCLNLKLPVELTWPEYEFTDKTRYGTVRLPRYALNQDFVEWFYYELEVQFLYAALLYTPPYGVLPPHLDTIGYSNFAKLNWQKGGNNSKMHWHVMKNDKKMKKKYSKDEWYKLSSAIRGDRTWEDQEGLDHLRCVDNMSYAYPDPEDVETVYTADIGTPSLINGGLIHSMINYEEPRYVLTAAFTEARSSKRLEWDAAKEIFKKYVV